MPESKPPPSGWQSPQPDPSDIDALGQVARALLESVPAELQARFVEAIRALLEAIRSLLEWWIERLEGRSDDRARTPVRDIPIS